MTEESYFNKNLWNELNKDCEVDKEIVNAEFLSWKIKEFQEDFAELISAKNPNSSVVLTQTMGAEGYLNIEFTYSNKDKDFMAYVNGNMNSLLKKHFGDYKIVDLNRSNHEGIPFLHHYRIEAKDKIDLAKELQSTTDDLEESLDDIFILGPKDESNLKERIYKLARDIYLSDGDENQILESYSNDPLYGRAARFALIIGTYLRENGFKIDKMDQAIKHLFRKDSLEKKGIYTREALNN